MHSMNSRRLTVLRRTLLLLILSAAIGAQSADAESASTQDANPRFRAAVEARHGRGGRSLEMFRADWVALMLNPALTGTIQTKNNNH